MSEKISNEDLVLALVGFYYVYEPEAERFEKYREFATYRGGQLQMCSFQKTHGLVEITEKGYAELRDAYKELSDLGWFDADDEDDDYYDPDED
jgi:hypothetical protein